MRKLFLLVAFVSSVSVMAQPCHDLFVSAYVEGSGSNKAIEVYNPSLSSVDLTPYSIVVYFNGATDTSGGRATIQLSGTLQPGDVWILADDGIDTTLIDKNTVDSLYSGGFLFNGDDAIALVRDSIVIDVIGQIGLDPDAAGATDTGFGTGEGITVDRSLVRARYVQAPTSLWVEQEWQVHGTDDMSMLGAHGSCCESNLQTTIGATPDQGTANGVAWVAVQGGAPGYLYSWSNGAVDSFAAGLSGGEQYMVTVTDSYQCTIKDSVVVPMASSAGFPNRTSPRLEPSLISASNAQFKVLNAGGTAISVFNVLGKRVAVEQSLEGGAALIQLATVEGGMYFVVVDGSVFRLIVAD